MELLQNVLGDNGAMIWKKANGIDNSPVQPYSEQKSMSSEETFSQDTIDINKLKDILITMGRKSCASACVSENKPHLPPHCQDSLFRSRHTQPCCYRIAYTTSSDHTLIACVKELFNKLYNRRMLIRLVGVKLSHLVGGSQQIDLFEKQRRDASTLFLALMTRCVSVYGEDKIGRAVE